MRWITILNSENIYLGYDAALRRNILDVLDRNHISCRDNWRARPAGGLQQRDRAGQSTDHDILYRIDVHKDDADEAVHLLKQAGIF